MATTTSRTSTTLGERDAVAPLRRLWQVPTFLLGLLAVIGVALARPLWHVAAPLGLEDELTALRKAVEEPSADLPAVAARLDKLLEKGDQAPEILGETHYLLGSLLVRQAIREEGGRATATWNTARTHLEEAMQLGIPRELQPRLHYRLAHAWLRTGGDKPRILEYLNQALGQGAEDRAEAFGLLAQAHLLPPADVRAALDVNAKQLAQPTADERVLAPARLLRGELLVQQREFAKAREALRSLGRAALPAQQARSRFLLAQCHQEEQQWQLAAALWEQVLVEKAYPPADVAAVAFDLGTCYRRLPGRTREAAEAWKRVLPRPGIHAQAAALRLAELYLHEKTGEDALPYVRQALDAVKRPEDYTNPLIPLAETKTLLEQGCTHYQEAGDYPRALDLAQLLGQLDHSGKAPTLEANLRVAWARTLRDKDREKARILANEAGQAYERAIAAGGVAAELLPRAAEAYRDSGSAPEVLRVLRAFVDLPNLNDKKGDAWFRLGEAHETLGQGPAAKEAYSVCLKYRGPLEPFARYRLALLDLAAGKIGDAIMQLHLNADLLRNTPEEPRNRDLLVQTLVTLADLLVQQGQPDNFYLALSHYSDVLNLLGRGPVAWRVRFQQGDCYRKQALAQANRGQDLSPSVLEAKEKHRQENLRLASKEFEDLEQDMLKHQAAGTALTPEQQGLLDGLDFRIAGARFDQGDFPRARERYQTVADKRRGTLEELIALEGVALCHAQFNNRDDLGKTLDRIQTAVAGLPNELFTEQTERQQRRYWTQLLPKKLGAVP